MFEGHFRLIGLIFCFAATGPVVAETVEFTFEGTIDVSVGTFNPPFAAIAVGDTYTFRFVFESTTPDTEASPTLGIYFDPVQSFEMIIGAASMTDIPDVSFIAVDDETVPGLESFEVGIGELAFIFGGQVGLPVGTLLSDALPTTFDLADLSGFQFSVFDTLTEGSAIGTLTAFSDGGDDGGGNGNNGNGGEVPTVSTWGLFSLGLILAAGAKIMFGRRQDLATAMRLG